MVIALIKKGAGDIAGRAIHCIKATAGETHF
jgi:hypothetical protein